MQDRAPRSASALRKLAPCMHRPILLLDCDPGYTGCRRAYRIRNQLHLARTILIWDGARLGRLQMCIIAPSGKSLIRTCDADAGPRPHRTATMPTYYNVPTRYAAPSSCYLYANGAPWSRPSHSSPAWSVQHSPVWTVQSSPPPTPSPRGPPEAPRPRTIPLPGIARDDHHQPAHPPQRANSPYQLYHRPTYRHPTGCASVDPILATPQHPTATPSLTWDMMLAPMTALHSNPAISPAELRRSAIRTSGWNRQPIHSLVLMFPYLPMEIEIKASRMSSVTVEDVLEGLYHALRAPIERQDFRKRSESEQSTLLRASERRRRLLPEDSYSREALLKIDFLGRRRRFMGIRPALPYEVPRGGRGGEVYIVEVGLCD
ncbi:hypothetical protein C8Q76DRAFT_760098 [Earliella scabrosa]|nr:hypothetical protein C8Q76DRAFT_760098 [Earliella scabrosa]